MNDGYIPRIIDQRLADLLVQVPAIMLVGPRAAGKTTTARRFASSVLRLDVEAEASVVRADPDVAIRGLAEPILIDEWQVVPEVLGAVKRAVDAQRRPGRFLLTGSARADLDTAMWPGTGRVVRLTMLGLTERELGGRANWPSPLSAFLGGELPPDPVDPPDLGGYVDRVLRSGFPEPAIHLSGDAHRVWMRSYVDHIVTRDAPSVDTRRDPERLRRYLRVLGGHTAQIVEDKTLYDAAGVNRKTSIAYENVLETLFVLDRLPAWESNVIKQLVRRPKRHVVDPSVAATALRVAREDVMRRGDLLGHLLESFVAAQIRSELAASPATVDAFHVRDAGGRHEIDLVLDGGSHGLAAIEVKAGAAPRPADAFNLRWFVASESRDVHAYLFHTGPRVFRLADDVIAAPIACLWS